MSNVVKINFILNNNMFLKVFKGFSKTTHKSKSWELKRWNFFQHIKIIHIQYAWMLMLKLKSECNAAWNSQLDIKKWFALLFFSNFHRWKPHNTARVINPKFFFLFCLFLFRSSLITNRWLLFLRSTKYILYEQNRKKCILLKVKTRRMDYSSVYFWSVRAQFTQSSFFYTIKSNTRYGWWWSWVCILRASIIMTSSAFHQMSL